MILNIILDFMQILDITKDTVLFNEGDQVENLYYVINGKFEVTKTVLTHINNDEAQLQYAPLEPSQTVIDSEKDFFNQHENLCYKYVKPNMNEIQMFYHKPNLNILRLYIAENNDVIGTEEFMIGDRKRFTKITCASKTAKIVKFSSQKLFKKLTDADTLKEITSYAKNKLQLISNSIQKFHKFQNSIAKKQFQQKEMKRISNKDPQVVKVIDFLDNKYEQLFVSNVIKGKLKFTLNQIIATDDLLKYGK